MKNTYITLVILFWGYSVSAQDTACLKIFDADKNGITFLEATESYMDLSDYDKSSSIKMVLSDNNNNNIIVIDYGHLREMWKKNDATKEFVRFDILNIDNPDLQRFVKKHPERFMKHPWFFYFGGQYSVNPDMNAFSAFGSVRGGFFLLANRWDIAVSFMAGYNADDEGTDGFIMSVGLVSKVYFPIKKIGLSPYVGAGISCNFDSDFEPHLDVPVVVGLSWRLGPGSLDIGFQYGLRTAFIDNIQNTYMGIIGYTFCPLGNRK